MGRSGALHRWTSLGTLALAVAAASSAAGGASAAKGPGNELRVLRPVADTYVTAARPVANFGRASVLRVSGMPETRAYLRFEPKHRRGEIASVTLLLHALSSGRARYAVRRADGGEWPERLLTYDDAPEPSLRYVSGIAVRRGAWSAVDVTPLAAYGKRDHVTFALTTRGTRAVVFGSRESRYGPRLVVRFRQRDDSDERRVEAPGRD